MTEKRILNDWLLDYMKYTENTEPPILYRLWVGISTIASCLQRKCSLEWQTTIYPNMFVVLVGPSGKCRKGEAMRPGEELLQRLGIEMAADAITKEALVRTIRDSVVNSIDAHTGEVSSHCSLTILSKELAVFLGYNNPELLSWLTAWYDCTNPWIYATKNKGKDQVHGICVNFIGATTPQLITATLPVNAIGCGLTSRMIFVNEKVKGKRVVFPIKSNETIELGLRLESDLEAILTLSGKFKFVEKFFDFWEPWYNSNEDNPPFKDPTFDGYVSRRPTHLLKLCMIMSASRNNDMVITVGDAERALEILVQTERNMGQIFRGVGKSRFVDTLNIIQDEVQNRGKVNFSVLMGMVYQDCTKREALEILMTLESMDKITIDAVDHGKDYILRWKGEGL